MSTRDLLLMELYHTPRDERNHQLVARYSPVIYFDAREPFLPLAAGYTIFTQDLASPSFDRVVELRPEPDDESVERPPAAVAIEYAIWWDWDIHHLYELEHVWVYLDPQGQVVRVEGSWHGKYYEIPVSLENGHPVLLSEPGKHAFAPHPDWFYKRQREYRRPETRAISAHAHVLVNGMFAGQIRQRVFDRVLARGYLLKQAFDPSWSFTQRYTFPVDALVPWPDLVKWIPQRVNAWLERLEAHTRPTEYRSMRLVRTDGSLTALKAAAHSAADVVSAPVSLRGARLVLGDNNQLGDPADLSDPLDLEEALKFTLSEPMGMFYEVDDLAVIERLAWFIRSNDLQGYGIVTSPDAGVLVRYQTYVPGGLTALQLNSPDQDPLEAVQVNFSPFIWLCWTPDDRAKLTPEWIERVHQAGLGLISWPTHDLAEMDALQRLGMDILCLDEPLNPAG